MPADLNALINPQNLWLFLVLAIWSLIWKGLALWHSASRHQRNWFIAMLILNTFGILEIIYLFFVVKIQVKGDERR